MLAQKAKRIFYRRIAEMCCIFIVIVYNKDKQKIGKIVERGSGIKLKEDEYFLYVQCCILNNENKILITRRDFAKPFTRPGGKIENFNAK